MTLLRKYPAHSIAWVLSGLFLAGRLSDWPFPSFPGVSLWITFPILLVLSIAAGFGFYLSLSMLCDEKDAPLGESWMLLILAGMLIG